MGAAELIPDSLINQATKFEQQGVPDIVPMLSGCSTHQDNIRFHVDWVRKFGMDLNELPAQISNGFGELQRLERDPSLSRTRNVGMLRSRINFLKEEFAKERTTSQSVLVHVNSALLELKAMTKELESIRKQAAKADKEIQRWEAKFDAKATPLMDARMDLFLDGFRDMAQDAATGSKITPTARRTWRSRLKAIFLMR